MVRTLWKFSRPHTVIGTITSIITLFVIICPNNKSDHFPLLFLALLTGIFCNIFIVGINQVADVHIDKINKPYLPIPAGELTVKMAKTITLLALALSLGIALYISVYLFFIILFATGIGWAYSMPPFYFKKHHISAALSITMVRGILINAGGFMVFNYIVNRSIALPDNVKILSAFIIVFSVVIAWFKDLPDIEGDSAYRIKSLAIQFSPGKTFSLGIFLLIFTYSVTIIRNTLDLLKDVNPSVQAIILFSGHILLLALFIINACIVDLKRHPSIKHFYKRFWWFFFAEYVLYLFAYSV